jgi:hypothetical protein
VHANCYPQVGTGCRLPLAGFGTVVPPPTTAEQPDSITREGQPILDSGPRRSGVRFEPTRESGCFASEKGHRQMLSTMERSTDKILAYTISGDMTKADYQTLAPVLSSVIAAQGSVSVLFDLTGFQREKITALGSNVDFGQQFQGKIDKMALVGDSKWESHLTKLVQPYDAKESKFFETDDDAWTWLTG